MQPAPRGSRVPRTLVILIALLVLVAGAYAATGPARRSLWERFWYEQTAVRWAKQQQEHQLTQRRLRADLRGQLRLLAEQPEEFPALVRAASIYGQLQEYDDALFLLDEAERIRPGDLEVARARSQVYFSTGTYDRCLETIERALKHFPDDLELGLMELDVYAVLGWTSQARAPMRRLVDRYGDREARVHLMAALLARQMADAREATAHLRAAGRLDPHNDKVFGLLSGLEWELGQRNAALDDIYRALELNPNSADYYIHLAEIQAREAGGSANRVRQAERSYRRAVEINPSSTQARFGVARCRLLLGDPQGQRLLEALYRANPSQPAILLELGNLYTRQGRREEGAALLTRYQEQVRENDELKGMSLRMVMQPNSAANYREMGELHLRTGSPQKAVVMLRRALRLNPRDAAARRDLQQALYRSERAQEIPAVLARP